MLKIGLFPPSGFRDTEFILRMEPDGVMAREKAAASGCESLARLLAALIIIIILIWTDLMVAPFPTGQKFSFLAHTSVTSRIGAPWNMTLIDQMVTQ